MRRCMRRLGPDGEDRDEGALARAATRPPRGDPGHRRSPRRFNIRVFGSVARGEAGEGSDVDFLVDIESGRSLFDLGAFYADLEDLLGCEIDVGTQIKARLREQVESEAVLL